MADNRTALFVRLPRNQAAALDRLADATGRQKQHLVSELLGDRLDAATRPLPLGRLEITNTRDLPPDDVLTLEEVAALFKLPLDTVRSRAERGDLPGRRFGKEWRFARSAVLTWLADGETRERRNQRASTPESAE
jgi:excisionase family DNA binding protein